MSKSSRRLKAAGVGAKTKRISTLGPISDAIHDLSEAKAPTKPESVVILDSLTKLEEFRHCQTLPPDEPRLLIPQIIVVLSPAQDKLQAELPGANGARRVIEFDGDPDRFYSACLRMLQAQARRQIEIGLDGAPTQAQVQHWQRHSEWPEPSCRFCIAEDRTGGPAKRQGRLRREIAAGDGSVTVRYLPAKKGQRAVRSAKTAEELGL